MFAIGYRVGIYDTDMSYALCLMEYFNKKTGNPFKVAVFSGQNALEEYLKEAKLQLLLLGETCSFCQEIPTIVLTEKRAGADGKNSVFKYQSMEEITRVLNQFFQRKLPSGNASAKVLGIYSPYGRCGKTKIAKAICKAWPGSLYLDFEEYSEWGPDNQKQREKNKDMERLLFYMISHNEEAISMLDQVLFEEDGYYLMPNLWDYTNYKQLRREDVTWFLTALQNKRQYSRIVFDFGIGVIGDLAILKCMERILVPVLKDGKKLGQFIGLMERSEYQEIEKRITYIEVPPVEDMEVFIEKLLEEL